MMRIFMTGFGLWLWAGICIADVAVKPFVAGSLDDITGEREGQAFVLLLWSKDCPPCLRELASLKGLEESLAHSLVLVSTDDAGHLSDVAAILRQHELNRMDNWIFNDPVIERSRYRVDPDWYGELPRAYFYDRAHQRKAHSGMIDHATLTGWLRTASSLTTSKLEP
jgi:thiol-disulfide isomerase/thioredoxin